MSDMVGNPKDLKILKNNVFIKAYVVYAHKNPLQIVLYEEISKTIPNYTTQNPLDKFLLLEY